MRQGRASALTCAYVYAYVRVRAGFGLPVFCSTVQRLFRPTTSSVCSSPSYAYVCFHAQSPFAPDEPPTDSLRGQGVDAQQLLSTLSELAATAPPIDDQGLFSMRASPAASPIKSELKHDPSQLEYEEDEVQNHPPPSPHGSPPTLMRSKTTHHPSPHGSPPTLYR